MFGEVTGSWGTDDFSSLASDLGWPRDQRLAGAFSVATSSHSAQLPPWLEAPTTSTSTDATSSASSHGSGSEACASERALGAAGVRLPDEVVAAVLAFVALPDLCKGCVAAGRALARAVVSAAALPRAAAAFAVHGSGESTSGTRGVQWSAAMLAGPPHLHPGRQSFSHIRPFYHLLDGLFGANWTSDILHSGRERGDSGWFARHL
jgi:hypothetical protein